MKPMLLFALLLAAAPADELASLVRVGEQMLTRLAQAEAARAAVDAAEDALDDRQRDLNALQRTLNADAATYRADVARQNEAVRRYNETCRGTLTEAALAACGAQRSDLEREDARLAAEPARIEAEQARLPAAQAQLERDVAAWNEQNLAVEEQERDSEYERSDWSARLNDLLTTSAWAEATRGIEACVPGANLTSDSEYFRQTLDELAACRVALRR